MNEQSIKALIIDDEQSACDILSQLLLRFCPAVEVVGICNHLKEGVNLIEKLQPDVVFLDIQMPQYAGYEIVNFFTEVNFEIIFVTAHDNYAVKAFEISAVDYLLKPIDIDKLKLAVFRLKDRINHKKVEVDYSSLMENLKHKTPRRLVISTIGDKKVLDIGKIIAIEANESYSNIHTPEDVFLVSKNLKHFERVLSDQSRFFRSHKSWLINLDYLNSYSKSKLEIYLPKKIIAKLSKLKKSEFEKQIK